MHIHEIENLSFAELKARRDELVEAAAQCSIADLAARYVQARTDATKRDEKLAEQGVTISALQTALEAAGQSAEAQKAELQKRAAAMAAAAKTETRLAAKCAELQAGLKGEIQRSSRLKAAATSHGRAVTSAAKLLNDALAAQAVESADSGE